MPACWGKLAALFPVRRVLASGDPMRSAEFDRDLVLRSAMEAFRARGYAKTTMQDLVAATGLHPAA